MQPSKDSLAVPSLDSNVYDFDVRWLLDGKSGTRVYSVPGRKYSNFEVDTNKREKEGLGKIQGLQGGLIP